MKITAKDQAYRYNGMQQGEGDTAYDAPTMIAEKVEVEGLKGADTLASILIDGQGTDAGTYPIKPQSAGIANATGNATGNYDINYVNGTLTILGEAAVSNVIAASSEPWDGKVQIAYERRAASEGGAYVTDIAFNPDVVGDPWSQNADGSYGAGTYDGPGPVLDLSGGDVTVSHRWAGQSSSSHAASYYVRASGDYEEIEMTFALKPFWDVTDWFRVRGTLGVALSRTHFAFAVRGQGYSGRQRFDDWAVYGVGGLGGMFRWKGFSLGVDFLARFLDDDIEIRGRDVRGSVERSPWMMTVFVGYEVMG